MRMKKTFTRKSNVGLPLGVIANFLIVPVALSQIRTDGSLGLAAQAISGPTYLIPQSVGKLAGNNLFHSFQTFSVGAGESALFSTSSAGLANVISRVTGGSASTINGLIALQSPGSVPNFFFINPAGVTFGAGASINVPGAFYVSTANYLKFADGNFYADTVTPSTLSSASPSAFGFLANSSAAVTALNTNPQNVAGQPARPSLFVGTDKAIHIIAGDVTINNSVIGNESGDVRVIAQGKTNQNAEVPLSGSYATAQGDLQILNGGQINSSTNSKKDVGSVQISAGNLTISKQTATRDTGIISQADAGASGLTGSMSIVATGDITMTKGGKISTSNGATAADPSTIKPGTLTILAKNISLDDAMITAESRGNVDASEVKIAATGTQSNPVGLGDFDSASFKATGDFTLSNGASINGNTYLEGKGASINLKAGNLAVNGNGKGTMIVSSTLAAGGKQSQATGDGGSIDITASALVLSAGGQIQSSTITRGKAGPVTVNADSVSIDGQSNQATLTGIFGTANQGSYGQAGTITINATGGAVLLANGGTLSVQNDATAPADLLAGISQTTLSVKSRSLTLDNKAQITASTSGNVLASLLDIATTGDVTLKNGSGIQGSTSGTANAATMNIASGGNLNLSDGAFVNGNTSMSGNAADIIITAANVSLDGNGKQAIISSESNAKQVTAFTTGHGGSVSITSSGALKLLNGGQIKSSTNTPGNAGLLNINVGTLSIDNTSPNPAQTGIFNTTTSTGDSQNITIKVGGTASVSNQGQINANTMAAGKAGQIDLAVGTLSLTDGGYISSDSNGKGDAAGVSVKAVNVTIDGGTNFSKQTGIYSTSGPGCIEGTCRVVNNNGNAGNIELTLSGNLQMTRQGQISSDTSTNGHAGSITISAKDIALASSSINSSSKAGSNGVADGTGDAGTIKVTASGDLTMSNLAAASITAINSSTFTSGAGGEVSVKASNITLDSKGFKGALTGIMSLAVEGTEGSSIGKAKSVDVAATNALTLLNTGAISSTNLAPQGAGAGTVTVSADTLILNGNGNISSDTLGGGNAGMVSVKANHLTIDPSKYAEPTATLMDPNGIAPKLLPLLNRVFSTGTRISSQSFEPTDSRTVVGNAGDVNVAVAQDMSVLKGGQISSATYSKQGHAKSVTVSAGSLTVDGFTTIDNKVPQPDGSTRTNSFVLTSNISAAAGPNSSGQTGSVNITTSGDTTVSNLAQLSVQNDAMATTEGLKSITNGTLAVQAQNITIDKAQITAATSGNVNASDISLIASGDLSMKNKAIVQGSTSNTGRAGVVAVKANNILIDGGAAISSDTTGAGAAGSVGINTRDALKLTQGGTISSSSQGATSTVRSGAAGAITLSTKTLLVQGSNDGRVSSIRAAAGRDSTGETGDITINASESITLANGATLSVQNNACIHPSCNKTPAEISSQGLPGIKPAENIEVSTLKVSAPSISLINAKISAESTGNVSSSNIKLAFADRLYLDPSSISTSANTGNGGAIDIRGGKTMVLDNSQVATSVLGLAGNGGNITLSADTLLMLSGFIQANTAGTGNSGGTVNINVTNLVPSGNVLFLGGQVPYVYQTGVFGFNVIQAAAPTGLSGAIRVTSPALDLSGALSGLQTQIIDTGGLGRSRCQATSGSSLVPTGRGGFPPSSRDLMGPHQSTTDQKNRPAKAAMMDTKSTTRNSMPRLNQSGAECMNG